jgi:heterodisulfide reductase subunit A-like polyferredoxin
MLGREMTLTPDWVVLSEPMVPAGGSKELGSLLKVPTDLDGWFLEAHVKLRPVDFSSDGIFMAGACHYPNFLDETIAQAQAAAKQKEIESRERMEMAKIQADREIEAAKLKAELEIEAAKLELERDKLRIDAAMRERQLNKPQGVEQKESQ